MKNKILLFLMLVFTFSMPVFTFAADEPDSFSIVNGPVFDKFVDKAGMTKQFDSQKTLPMIIGDIVSQLLELVGIVFTLLIIYGGVRWMTAGGDTGRVDKAKNVIINSSIGLIITLSAYAISYGIIEIFIKATVS